MLSTDSREVREGEAVQRTEEEGGEEEEGEEADSAAGRRGRGYPGRAVQKKELESRCAEGMIVRDKLPALRLRELQPPYAVRDWSQHSGCPGGASETIAYGTLLHLAACCNIRNKKPDGFMPMLRVTPRCSVVLHRMQRPFWRPEQSMPSWRPKGRRLRA